MTLISTRGTTRPGCRSWTAAIVCVLVGLASAATCADEPMADEPDTKASADTLTTSQRQDTAKAADHAAPSATAGEETPNEAKPLTAANDAGQSSGGSSRRQVLIASLTIFVLAVFVGFEVIAKVPPILHTPLMSGSNAISGITVVGAIIASGCDQLAVAVVGFLAVILANINVVGGFLVTHRMLMMFQKKR